MNYLRVLYLLPLLLLAGCVGTSDLAKQAIAGSVPLVASRSMTYAVAANDQVAISVTKSLQDVIKDTNKIDVDVVASKWTPVKTFYVFSLGSDARLSPTDIQIHKDTVLKIDAIIDKEQQRRKAAWMNFLRRP